MLFIVRVAAHGDEPEEYETSSEAGRYTLSHDVREYEADDIYGVIDQLLEEWVDGDADLPGALAFLKAEGYDFGIADEDVDEGTDAELLENAANAIRTILHIGMDDSEIDDAAEALEKLASFLAAIGDEYKILPADEDEDDQDKEAEETNKESVGDTEPEPRKAEAEADDDNEIDDEELEKALDEDYDY